MAVPYYNLRKYYPSDAQRLFPGRDSHWNEAGHAFAADRVEDWLVQNGLMSTGARSQSSAMSTSERERQ
jgi:hypothetical protein